jgi:hypothetical protein
MIKKRAHGIRHGLAYSAGLPDQTGCFLNEKENYFSIYLKKIHRGNEIYRNSLKRLAGFVNWRPPNAITKNRLFRVRGHPKQAIS